MPRRFKVISKTSNNEPCTHTFTKVTPEEKLKYFQNVANSTLQSAQGAWADLWKEFQGIVTDGVAILPEAEKGLFKPKCGWPEFLEKMWLLKHYLDYTQKFCEGKEKE